MTERRIQWAAAMAVACWLAAPPADCAQVVYVTGRTAASPHGEAFLKLASRESAAKGDMVKGPRDVKVAVLEVVGGRARVRIPRRGALRKGDAVMIPPQRGDKEPPPTLPRTTTWKVEAPLAGMEGAGDPTLWPAAWRRLRGAQRKLLVARQGARRRDAPGRLRGDLVLIGYGLLAPGGGPTQAAVRLSSRLELPQVAGLPLDYRHELSLYLDNIGEDQGGWRARRPIEVRRLELALAVAPGRSLGGRLGRLVVADGAGQQVVDGAAASYLVGESLQVDVFGGIGPDMVSLGPRFDVGRFGAGATWMGRLFDGPALASLAWGGSTFDGGLDRQVLGSRLHVDMPWGGRLQGQLDAALQQSAQDPAVQPHRAWLSLSSPTLWGWRARLRYSYYRALPNRELLASLPWSTFINSRRHDLYLQFDGPQDGWWWMPALWAGHRATDDRLDGFRAGASVRAGWTAGSWTWSTAVSAQSPISTLAMATVGSAVRGGALSLGCRWRLTEAFALSARLAGHVDEVMPVKATVWRTGGRLGLDWLSGPWLLDVGLGVDKAWAMESPWPANSLDWLDATMMLRRAF